MDACERARYADGLCVIVDSVLDVVVNACERAGYADGLYVIVRASE